MRKEKFVELLGEIDNKLIERADHATKDSQNKKSWKKWTVFAVSAAYYILLIAASAAICSIVGYPLWNKLTAMVPSVSLLLWPVAAGAAAWFVLFLDYRKDNFLTVVNVRSPKQPSVG